MCILPTFCEAFSEQFVDGDEFVCITRFNQTQLVEIYSISEPNKPGISFIREAGQLTWRGECESLYESAHVPTPRR